MSPQLVFRVFEQNGVDAVLIGGLAAVLLGVPIVTNDMGFCYATDSENVNRLVRALAPLHPRLRVARMSDDDAQALPFTWDARTLHDSPNLTLQTDAGWLDLISTVPGVGSFAEAHAAAVELDVDEIRVIVLDLPALVAGKRAVGRAKDLLALPQIETALRLRNEEV